MLAAGRLGAPQRSPLRARPNGAKRAGFVTFKRRRLHERRAFGQVARATLLGVLAAWGPGKPRKPGPRLGGDMR